ncbi:Histone acetyltransferase type B catalytic subunit [Hondaea fermentalgiana]|uniref:histone acetyltransferase n=1 Tax=Hondaea fermentalgiana TaxID=2315210 RepID=A0A2R5GSA0_9STRA|nr:Histone acetyltransferase type B catalytic subunit [Hondaea fermentalgiana]|eukprot:GBG33752.1 Histone acetyltransferase type B catalytic subunit [Hondaea fermentalgiana]
MSDNGDEARAAKRPRTGEEGEREAASSIFSSVMQRLMGGGAAAAAAAPTAAPAAAAAAATAAAAGASGGQQQQSLEAVLAAAAAAANAPGADPQNATNEDEQDNLDDEGNRILPEDYPQEYVNVVKDCVEIEVDGAQGTMTPLFTHQVFTRDKYLLGYKGFKAKFSYTKRWRLLFQVSHEGTLPASQRKPTWEVDKEPIDMVRDSGLLPINGEKASVTEDPTIFAKWKAEDQQADAELGLQGATTISSTDTDELLLCQEVCSNEERRILMSRLQAMSFWWIETAQQTDAEDPRWSLYVIRDASQPLIIGFLTLFEFHNPMRVEDPLTWRICQVVVLPVLQNQGIGQRIVKQIYLRAIADPKVHEVNVEEPCPAFVRLRDAVEFSLCLENNVFEDVSPKDATDEKDTNHMDDASRDRVCKTVKITRKQAQRCFDMLVLHRAEKSKDETALRRLRLALKRRIFALNLEGVQDLPRENLKQNLELLYEDLVDQFHSALRRVPSDLLA